MQSSQGSDLTAQRSPFPTGPCQHQSPSDSQQGTPRGLRSESADSQPFGTPEPPRGHQHRGTQGPAPSQRTRATKDEGGDRSQQTSTPLRTPGTSHWGLSRQTPQTQKAAHASWIWLLVHLRISAASCTLRRLMQRLQSPPLGSH
jgi:hypothetical protein